MEDLTISVLNPSILISFQFIFGLGVALSLVAFGTALLVYVRFAYESFLQLPAG